MAAALITLAVKAPGRELNRRMIAIADQLLGNESELATLAGEVADAAAGR